MKKTALLHGALSQVIAALGHGEMLVMKLLDRNGPSG